MMGYSTQDYWVFGHHPSCGMITQKNNILETVSVSDLRWGGGRHLLCWVCYEGKSVNGSQIEVKQL
jgi:hypothetical protein